MRCSAILVLLIVCSSPCWSQKLLFHKSRYKDALYETGDVIAFRLKGSKSKITGKIMGFEDSVIVFQDFKVNPQKISHMYVDRKTKNWYFMRYKYRRLLPIAGVIYLLADVVNTGELSKGTVVLSSGLIAGGFLAKWLISDALRIKGKKKLVITR